MGNRDLIIAGVKGGGATGAALANFSPLGTALPTAATGAGSALNVAFRDGGWCSENGLKKAVSEANTTVKAYGAGAPVRKLVTSIETTFELEFLESGTTPIEVYQRMALGTLAPDTAGAFDFTEGQINTQQYSSVFDLVDGPNRIRAVVPILEVTDRKDFEFKSASVVQYGVTLTAYPGSDGVSIHWYYLVAGLAH